MGADVVADESALRRPAAGLRPFIAYYAGYRQAGLGPARHRGLPSPYLTVIFTLDDPMVIAEHPDPRQPGGSYQTLVGGLHTTPALVTHDGRQSGVQLGMSPLGARVLLGLPAGELASIDLHGADVLGPLAGQVQDRLREAGSWPDRFAALDELLLARAAAADDCGGSEGVSPEVSYAWRRLLRTGGLARVTELAAETGWSERHLRGRFLAEIGLTPKAAARVIRFDRARRLLGRRVGTGGRPALASLAAHCGYYDQAHLDREFGSLAGCPPTTWLAEEPPRSDRGPDGAAGRPAG
jgi:AraC-like DNA-binding protein